MRLQWDQEDAKGSLCTTLRYDYHIMYQRVLKFEANILVARDVVRSFGCIVGRWAKAPGGLSDRVMWTWVWGVSCVPGF